MKFDYAKELGDFILCFGKLESTIGYAIIVISNKHFSGTKEFGSWFRNIIDDMSMAKKITILDSLIDVLELEEINKINWKNCIKEMKELNTIRNVYAHGMYGIIDDGSERLLKISKKKDKNGFSINRFFEPDDIKNENNKLHECYRQIFESVIEKSIYEHQGYKEFTWCNKNPQLFF